MRPLAFVAALVAVVATAGALLLRDDGEPDWIVRANLFDHDRAQETCGDLPGVGDRSRSGTTDLPPDVPSEGVYWTVTGRSNAEEVADCLRAIGAVDIGIDEPTDPRSLEREGP